MQKKSVISITYSISIIRTLLCRGEQIKLVHKIPLGTLLVKKRRNPVVKKNICKRKENTPIVRYECCSTVTLKISRSPNCVLHVTNPTLEKGIVKIWVLFVLFVCCCFVFVFIVGGFVCVFGGVRCLSIMFV
jgi:hypothetical protein